MADFDFLPAMNKTCKGASLPVTVQAPKAIFNTAIDGTTPTVIGPIAAGDPAPHGGKFLNKGCEDLLLTITYIVGSDCEPCNDLDELTTVDLPWTIYANSKGDIPDGFWTQISYTLANAANDAKPQTVHFQSCYTYDCPDCTIIVP